MVLFFVTFFLVNMGFMGGCILAPVFYQWYKYLDKIVVGKGAAVIVKKVVLDQLVASTFSICIFYIGKQIFLIFHNFNHKKINNIM